MKRAWIVLLVAGGATGLTASCSAPRASAPASEPLPVIAVLPGGEIAPLLVAELAKTGRWRASLAEEGRKPKADAILAVRITDFDPYDPPRVALSVRVQRGSGTGGGDLDRLSQAGVWERALRSGDPSGFDLVLDSRDRSTRAALEDYARTQDGRDSAFTGDREFLAVSSSYLRFAAHQVAARVIHER